MLTVVFCIDILVFNEVIQALGAAKVRLFDEVRNRYSRALLRKGPREWEIPAGKMLRISDIFEFYCRYISRYIGKDKIYTYL